MCYGLETKFYLPAMVAARPMHSTWRLSWSQYERAEDALQVKLRAFIADELRAWEKTFPDELWEEFGRLTNWQGPLHARPKWWGKLVIEMIYDTLDADVAEWLKTNKPPPGLRWHQQLTENYGARKLVSRCYEIIGMGKTCTTIRELRQKVAHHYGKEPMQLTMYLPRQGRMGLLRVFDSDDEEWISLDEASGTGEWQPKSAA